MFGPKAHPLFIQRFVSTSTNPFLARTRDVLALGNATYYIQDDTFRTRVYIYNYFRFLLDSPIPARWHMRFYGKNGRYITERSGEMIDHDTEIVELDSIPNLDEYGVLRTYLVPAATDVFIPDPHVTMFYNEYYRPNGGASIMGHNLHIPIATHGTGLHQRVSPGLVVPTGFKAYLFIAGGCNFHPLGHPACSNAFLTLVNDKGHARHVPVPSMHPLECHRLDLFAIDSGLQEHIGADPFILKITGQGFLAKPFFIFTNGVAALGEHT